MVKAHTPINWENQPSKNTPINEENLNKMDSTIGVLDDRIIEQDTSKLDKSTAYTMVKDISFNENNGIFTVTRLNGSTFTIDTKLEKIHINFDYNKETQQIEIILVDGTKEYIDISSLVSPIDFIDSDEIGWEVTSDWKVKAKVLNGSITEDMLQPNYLAEIKVESESAYQSALNAKTSETNAENSAIRAEKAAENAESGSGTKVVDIEQADYDKLENKQDNILYNITDSDEYIKAENVEYGDSDVKSALDGLNSNFTDYHTNKVLGRIEKYGILFTAYRKGDTVLITVYTTQITSDITVGTKNETILELGEDNAPAVMVRQSVRDSYSTASMVLVVDTYGKLQLNYVHSPFAIDGQIMETFTYVVK